MPPATILVVEDDPAMQIGLRDNLESEGHTVMLASDGASALAMLSGSAVDLIILDRMLPDMDGAGLCRQIRTKGHRIPVILLTARGEEMDRVLGFQLGADDYVVKPFSLLELLARIEVHLKRYAPPALSNEDQPKKVGEAWVDFRRHELIRDGRAMDVSVKEMELLRFLVKHRGEALSRDVLLDTVWGYQKEITTRTLDNFIVRLRKKIESDPASPAVLVTVHGFGYKLLDEPVR